MNPDYFHLICSFVKNAWEYRYIRVLLRFEFYVPHQMLYTTLATDEKWLFKSLSYLIPKLGNQLTKYANFVPSKSIFAVKNQPNLSLFLFFETQLLLKKNSKTVFIFCQPIFEFRILCGMWNSNLKRTLLYMY